MTFLYFSYKHGKFLHSLTKTITTAQLVLTRSESLYRVKLQVGVSRMVAKNVNSFPKNLVTRLSRYEDAMSTLIIPRVLGRNGLKLDFVV